MPQSVYTGDEDGRVVSQCHDYRVMRLPSNEIHSINGTAFNGTMINRVLGALRQLALEWIVLLEFSVKGESAEGNTLHEAAYNHGAPLRY